MRGMGFIDWVSDLARTHTRALSGVARAEGLTADDALDAVQEAFQTFLNLPEARDLVGKEQDSRRLLSAVVRNAARNMRRRAFRRLPHDNLADGFEIADDMPGVDELLARAEDELRLMCCVSQLSDVQQRVVRAAGCCRSCQATTSRASWGCGPITSRRFCIARRKSCSGA